jgi:hypothetical protein
MKECDNSTRKIHISSNFILSISQMYIIVAPICLPQKEKLFLTTSINYEEMG